MKYALIFSLALCAFAVAGDDLFAPAFPPVLKTENEFTDTEADKNIIRAKVFNALLRANLDVLDALDAAGYKVLAAQKAKPPKFHAALGLFREFEETRKYARYAKLKGYSRPLIHLDMANLGTFDIPDNAIIIADGPLDEVPGIVACALANSKARQIVLSWDKFNNLDAKPPYTEAAKQLAKAAATAKAIRPDCFVWVTFCLGSTEKEWRAATESFADGWAIWGPYKFPADLRLVMARLKKDGIVDRPCVIAGFYGFRPRKGAPPAGLAKYKRKIAEAKAAGYVGFWRLVGKLPNKLYPAAGFKRRGYK